MEDHDYQDPDLQAGLAAAQDWMMEHTGTVPSGLFSLVCRVQEPLEERIETLDRRVLELVARCVAAETRVERLLDQ